MSDHLTMESNKYFGKNRISCFCCGGSMSEGSDVCAHCQMPTAISKSAEERGVKPTYIPILGGSGAGKTVYIGMLLDMLSKGTHDITGQPNNSFSIAIQQETMTALERRRFPEKTPVELEEWNWVHCEIDYSKRRNKHQVLDLVAPDLAGEALVMELDHPNSFPVVQRCVTQASGIILLIDASKVRYHGTEEDLLATKIAAYVKSNSPRSGLTRKNTGIPLALTFTKTDLVQEASDDPMKFAQHNLPGFYAYAERNLPNCKFFGSSVVGSVTKVSDQYGDYHLPLHVQPQGIVEPLVWLMQS